MQTLDNSDARWIIRKFAALAAIIVLGAAGATLAVYHGLTAHLPYFIGLVQGSLLVAVTLYQVHESDKQKSLSKLSAYVPNNSQLHCPDCSGHEFFEGPSAGVSTNIKCANPRCQSEFCWHGAGPLERISRVR